MVKIFIDPGHGGTDAGAADSGLLEKNLTLQIAIKIKNILLSEYKNVTVKMSRTKDKTVSLKERTDQANAWGADFFLSVHINAGGGTGYEDYVYTKAGTNARNYQKAIHEEVLKQNGLKDRGRKTGNLYVLHRSAMPAILTENGFIDSKDSAELKNASYIEAVARGHVNGLVNCFKLEKASKAIYHKVAAGDTVYGLSLLFGSAIKQIKEWNGLDESYTIKAGQKLRVK